MSVHVNGWIMRVRFGWADMFYVVYEFSKHHKERIAKNVETG